MIKMIKTIAYNVIGVSAIVVLVPKVIPLMERAVFEIEKVIKDFSKGSGGSDNK